MKYYKNTNGSVYRTEKANFNDGSPTLKIERFNWDFINWSGHIHDHKETKRRIKELDGISEITKQEADKLTNL